MSELTWGMVAKLCVLAVVVAMALELLINAWRSK